MGRPRRYEDDAARKRAQREREKSPVEEVPDAGSSKGRMPGPDPGGLGSSPSPAVELTEENLVAAMAEVPEPDDLEVELARAEELYVEQALEQTRAHIRTLRAPEKVSEEAIAARLGRAETYARWRFREYMEGTVASL